MYSFRDFTLIKNNHFQKWKRHTIPEIKKLLIPGTSCFATIQRFRNALQPKNGEQQQHIVPLFFDLDHEDLEVSRQDAIKVLDFLTETYDIPETYVKVKFSGGKGFHIITHPALLPLEGWEYNTSVIGMWANDIRHQLGLKSFDMGVYTWRRMMRIENTKHNKSGLYCVALYHDELRNKSIPEIQDLAKAPRDSLFEAEEYEGISPNSTMTEVFIYYKKKIDEGLELQKLKPSQRINVKDKKNIPVCVKDLLENGLRGAGTRNRATMALSAYFKDAGYPQAEAETTLLQWISAQHKKFYGDRPLGLLKANTRSVVQAIYCNEKYYFSCAFILSAATPENKINCATTNCHITNTEQQQPDAPINVGLLEAGNPVYLNKPLRIDVNVIGKHQSPFIVPQKLGVWCTPSPDKARCIMCKFNMMRQKCGKGPGDELIVKISASKNTFVKFLNTPDSKLFSEIKHYLKIPGDCKEAVITIHERVSVESLVISPAVEDIGMQAMLDTQYVQRQAFSFPAVDNNKEYQLTAHAYPHPKTQSLCFIVHQVEEKKQNYERFKMSDELFDKLRIFQANGNIAAKLDSIYDDMTFNIVKIYGRKDAMMAVDMAYHSVGVLKWDGKEFKGAVELMLFGDTGCAKTSIVQGLMKHYRVGTLVNGETTKRTGLVYNYQKFNDSYMLLWGIIPMNHKKLVAIDEFTGLDRQEIEKMSRLRSEGIAEASGIIKGKTPALTRLIYMSNTADGRYLNQYGTGAQALIKLFNKREDIRRLDIAYAVNIKDVDPREINKVHNSEVDHTYNSDLCNLLIMWAWSRKATDIKIEDETLIYNKAMELCSLFDCDCPLVNTSDMAKKLFKMSTALACRLFSTSDGVDVIVRKEHIEYISDYLTRIYKETLRLDMYANAYRRKNTLTDIEKVKLTKHLKSYTEWKTIARIFLSETFVKVTTIKNVLTHKEIAEDFVKFLTEHMLVEQKSFGFVKTEKLIEILKELFDEYNQTIVPKWYNKNEISSESLELLDDIDIGGNDEDPLKIL